MILDSLLSDSTSLNPQKSSTPHPPYPVDGNYWFRNSCNNIGINDL
jgi:hypothetical protein